MKKTFLILLTFLFISLVSSSQARFEVKMIVARYNGKKIGFNGNLKIGFNGKVLTYSFFVDDNCDKDSTDLILILNPNEIFSKEDLKILTEIYNWEEYNYNWKEHDYGDNYYITKKECIGVGKPKYQMSLNNTFVIQMESIKIPY